MIARSAEPRQAEDARRRRVDAGEGPGLLEQHKALRRLIGEVEAILATVTPARVPAALSARLADLEIALEAHFTHEERSGLFERLAEEAPERAAAAAALLAEHGRLRQRAAALRTRALRDRGPSLAAAVRRLLHALERHEARENELLLDAVGTESTAQD
jgi:hemerythrin-like domain-containing protein